MFLKTQSLYVKYINFIFFHAKCDFICPHPLPIMTKKLSCHEGEDRYGVFIKKDDTQRGGNASHF